MRWRISPTRTSIGSAVIVALGVLISVLVWHRFELAEETHVQHEFEVKARDLERALAHQIDIALLRLEAIVGFYNGSEVVDRDEFHHFTQPLLEGSDVIQVLAWVPWVEGEERESVETSVAGLQERFEFSEENAQGQWVRRSEAERYFPIYFIEPFEPSHAPLGFDYGSKPWALEALDRAVDTNGPAASTLFESGSREGLSFLFFWPISGNLKARLESSVAEAHPLGFAVGEIHLQSIMSVAWENFDLSELAVRFVGDSAEAGVELSEGIGGGQGLAGREGAAYIGNPSVPGRDWRIEIQQMPEFALARETAAPLVVLVIGLVLTTLLAALYAFVLRAQRYASDKKFRQVVNAVPDSILLVNHQDVVTLANPASKALFGCKIADLIGERLDNLIPGLSEGAEPVSGGQQGERMGTPYFLTEGTHTPVAARFSRLETETSVQRIVVISDLTEQLEMENQQRRYEQELERSNRDLRDFAFVASHDLKEPMRVVSSYCELLVQRYKDVLDEKAQRYITHIASASIRMQVLIQALLDYSRVDSRGKPLKPVSLDAVLAEALENLRVTIRRTDAEIVRRDPLPEVMADPVQMVQVFQNLIGNALKFADGPPYVEICARSIGGLPDRVEVSVCDHGTGIDEEFREEVFNIFRRLESQDKTEGTGIGLAICRRILERHNGAIWVENGPECGCRFVFTLEAVASNSPATTMEQYCK